MVIFILIYFVTGCYMAANLCLTMEEPFFPLDDAKETFDRIIGGCVANYPVTSISKRHVFGL